MAEKSTGHIYTVSNLTRDIKTLLEETFPFVWVTGEISNFATPASGHSYFTLKDSNAVISAVMFKNQKRSLKFEPENGMKIFGLARITLYEPRGAYQLIFEHLEPDGSGSLQVAFEQLKNKLHAEGLFDEKYKKAVPFLPEKVTVITSKSGAALRDIINVSQRRFPNCRLDIFPVKVQGDGAVEQICEAIDLANRDSASYSLSDTIIIARGGGSLEDLAAFNSEAVARSIFASQLPVITGVGHETDYTIADFTADLRAPTPSAAAELAFPDKKILSRSVQEFQTRIHASMINSCKMKQDALNDLSSRLKTPVRRVYDYRLKLSDDQHRLTNAMDRYLDSCHQRLLRLTDTLEAGKPENAVMENRARLNFLTGSLTQYFGNIVQSARTAHIELQTKLEAISPNAVLNRGYSITRTVHDRQVIKNSEHIHKNDLIQVLLSKGELIARVEDTDGQKKNI